MFHTYFETIFLGGARTDSTYFPDGKGLKESNTKQKEGDLGLTMAKLAVVMMEGGQACSRCMQCGSCLDMPLVPSRGGGGGGGGRGGFSPAKCLLAFAAI